MTEYTSTFVKGDLSQWCYILSSLGVLQHFPIKGEKAFKDRASFEFFRMKREYVKNFRLITS